MKKWFLSIFIICVFKVFNLKQIKNEQLDRLR
jgi:hypothetical protein